MDGLFIIDKHAGLTSHDVVDRVRSILKTRRVGHTGTLDPFATGVMVILVGKATRLAQFLDKDEKEYEAVVQFGFETDTGDVTGVRSAECGVQSEEVAAVVAATDWPTLLAEFTGQIEQVPPMYSAKKIDGKKLYESARKGLNVERKPVTVTIKTLELIDSALHAPHSALKIRVVCSAGTYIRTLAEDIGRRVGTGAHLAELRRTRAGRFDISQSITLDALAALDDPAARLLPVSEAVAHLPSITMAGERIAAMANGLSSRIDGTDLADDQAVSMLDGDGALLAVGIFDADEMSVRPKVVLV
jgi:tRNA pseudouridine55 synthase